ncbi:hypothetical protein SEA_ALYSSAMIRACLE_90 [Gordonia phage Alyssamiracle]|nr:hypothetical protein SEA_ALYSSAMIRACLE_90 [Gordonia phage Alyssamiracle]
MEELMETKIMFAKDLLYQITGTRDGHSPELILEAMRTMAEVERNQQLSFIHEEVQAWRYQV